MPWAQITIATAETILMGTLLTDTDLWRIGRNKPQNLWGKSYRVHPAGHMIDILQMPGIREAGHLRWRYRDQNRRNHAKIPHHLVLSREPLKLGLLNALMYPLSDKKKQHNKDFLFLLSTTILEVTTKINVSVASDVINQSKSID